MLKNILDKLSIEILVGAKTHIGAKTAHKAMKKYLLQKDGSVFKCDDYNVIDVRETLVGLERAVNVLYKCALKEQRILFVGTNPLISDLVADASEKCAQHHVSKKWQGGMLTNFDVVRQSLKQVKEMRKAIESGSLKKKDQIMLQRKIDKKLKRLSGIQDMGGLPHVVVVFNVDRDCKAVKEASSLGITVIGICDTDIDPSGVNVIVPSNDDASSDFFVSLFSAVIMDGMKEAFENEAAKKKLDAENKKTSPARSGGFKGPRTSVNESAARVSKGDALVGKEVSNE